MNKIPFEYGSIAEMNISLIELKIEETSRLFLEEAST